MKHLMRFPVNVLAGVIVAELIAWLVFGYIPSRGIVLLLAVVLLAYYVGKSRANSR